jgi:hypothetical protein
VLGSANGMDVQARYRYNCTVPHSLHNDMPLYLAESEQRMFVLEKANAVYSFEDGHTVHDPWLPSSRTSRPETARPFFHVNRPLPLSMIQASRRKTWDCRARDSRFQSFESSVESIGTRPCDEAVLARGVSRTSLRLGGSSE